MKSTEATIPRDEKFALTASIIAGAIEVHRSLGPGFVEQVYHQALLVELATKGLACGTEVQVPIYHKGVVVGRHELDLLVQGQVIVELKSVRKLDPVHFAQVRSYLAATAAPIGLLFNFGGFQLETRRVFNTEERAKFLGSRTSRVHAPPVEEITDAAVGPAPTPPGGS